MENLPVEVKENIKFLESKNVWFRLSKNIKAVSCGDAANKRARLGNLGIPIFDELKTELGEFKNKEGKFEKVLVHCRANQKLDRLAVSGLLNSEYKRIDSNEFTKGLINPFGKEFRNLFQVFDISVARKFLPPYTMMTNAGDFEFAFEFDACELIKQLDRTIVDDVTRIDNYNKFIKHKVGIVTGNGPDSGVLLWKKINESVKTTLLNKLNQSFKGDLSYPEIAIESVPELGISMDLKNRLDATESAVIKSVINLCKNGATIICVACNTTHYFQSSIEKVCSLYDVEFLSIPTELEKYLLNKGIKTFDFIGISYVVDFEKYSAFKNLQRNFEINIPNSATLNKIDEIAYNAKKDSQNNKTAQTLGDILKLKTKSDIIVIALTEISVVLDFHRRLVQSKTVIDTLQILADSIAKKFVDGFFDTVFVDESKNLFFYEIFSEQLNEFDKNKIWQILVEINYEFVPPLSYRDSTTFSFENEVVEYHLPEAYFQNILEQSQVVCRNRTTNDIVGFMSYIPNHVITQNGINLSCNYITTIGVTKGARGNGITVQFYREIEQLLKKNSQNRTVATRTWSMNTTHIKILESLGYKKILDLKDDRGPGINTVYYSKEI